MKSPATILRTLVAAALVAALTACGGGSGSTDTNSAEYLAYMERHEAMEALGEAILVLNDMVAEEIPVDEAAFLGAARTIATGAGTLLDHFENQTLVYESRTMPEVWQNWSDFTAKNDALVAASNALVAAASSGGFAAGRNLVAPMRDTCGACHRPYRGPEKE